MAMASAMSTRAQVVSSSFIGGETTRSLKVSPALVSFGVKPCNARVSCSLEDDVRGFVQKFADAGKAAAVTLAATAIIGASPVNAAPRLTFDEIRSQTYSEVKGTGAANQCPVLSNESADGFALAPGKYSLSKFCMEPTSFTVKSEGTFKGESSAYQKTKLMTRLTYSLDEMEGAVTVGSNGTVTLTETDGIDYAAVTVQLPGGERVPFLFTVKELVATGPPDDISGTFIVPSYRGSTFLDPKGRGGSTGYDNAVALPAGGRGDEEDLGKENTKNTTVLEGKISFSVAKSDPSTGEIAGVFLSIQPSDTDLGAKVPKDIKIEGIWYGQLQVSF